MITTVKTLIRIVKECIDKVLPGNKNARWHEVKYFHPKGKIMPNGSHYQRGGFIHECSQNFNSFVPDSGVHGSHYGMSEYRGGIIVFPAVSNSMPILVSKFYSNVKQVITDLDFIGEYAVGHHFKGRYVGNKGDIFDDNSLSVEINRLSSASLLKVAEMLAHELMLETVIVKDLNNNKIYIAELLEKF